MPSFFKRIAPKADDESSWAQDVVDPDALLPQVRAGLNALEETQTELNRREQELLAEASILYEQLKVVATALADTRLHKEIAADNADKFQAAIQTLERQRSETNSLTHSDPARPEALVIQPKA